MAHKPLQALLTCGIDPKPNVKDLKLSRKARGEGSKPLFGEESKGEMQGRPWVPRSGCLTKPSTSCETPRNLERSARGIGKTHLSSSLWQIERYA